MPRRRKAEKRVPAPDPKYNSVLVSRFINGLMQRGKKSTAESIFFGCMERIEQQTSKPGLEVFEKAISEVKPMLEIKSRRVGGATYQVPVEVHQDRQISLAIRWLISYSRQRAGKSLVDKLSAEMIAAANKEGAAIKKREDTHKMAEANRAFAHFKW